MEENDEVVERQQLVEDELELEEEKHLDDKILTTLSSQNQSSSNPTNIPSTPVIINKNKIKSISSNDTTTKSPSCSIEQEISEKGQISSKVTYINERKLKQDDPRFECRTRPRKLLKELNLNKAASNSSLSYLDTKNKDNFERRPIKHHSFVSEVPDVKHMESALLGLLEDFQTGKLKAFGSGCTMEQMTKIREQQESLAKLHFELASAEDEDLSNDHAAKAQENMMQLVQRLEQLSVSIEQLQTSCNTGL